MTELTPIFDYYNQIREESERLNPGAWESLPIQYMDQPSATQLLNLGNPRRIEITDIFPDFVRIPMNEILRYLPSETDFQDPNHFSTIHGITHLSRVVVYALILAQVSNLDEIQTNIVGVAAGRHDIGRIDDREDREHGLRSGLRIKDLADHLVKKSVLNTKDSLDEIALISTYHEYPYDLIPEGDRLKYKATLDVLMGADALDRYRLQRTKWWPNPQYLQSEQARKLIEFSKYMTLTIQSLIYSEIPFDGSIVSNDKLLELCLKQLSKVTQNLGITR